MFHALPLILPLVPGQMPRLLRPYILQDSAALYRHREPFCLSRPAQARVKSDELDALHILTESHERRR